MVRLGQNKPVKIHINAWSAISYALSMHGPAARRPRRAK
ncbi:hypothetical protein HMPREF9257_1467 [Eremococcus coleocola ACS-139-V-Col8]|uniref:Uncharacterized protein n=1 Tax=Eremococcus coleocola ACS-139-V-Col8 TaxID=908337 RepID=E4KPH9_9LACT|nr:hypothetical protein HMPREF9257_1467 [Eremococcus coleocola ACS-139-V-Col8]